MAWDERQELYMRVPKFTNEADPLGKNIPRSTGLYLVGNTAFNPYTGEQLFAVKVGYTGRLLEERMRDYRSTNPLLFHIDYCTDRSISEYACHEKLLTVCNSLKEGTSEWFLVSKEIYLDICAKGFKWFFQGLLSRNL